MHVNIHGIGSLKMLCPLLDVQGDKSRAILPHINHLFLQKKTISQFFYIVFDVPSNLFNFPLWDWIYDVFWVGLVEC